MWRWADEATAREIAAAAAEAGEAAGGEGVAYPSAERREAVDRAALGAGGLAHSRPPRGYIFLESHRSAAAAACSCACDALFTLRAEAPVSFSRNPARHNGKRKPHARTRSSPL